MTTIRVRQPDSFAPPRYTIEWYGAMGDGCWMVLRNGVPCSKHYWRLCAWIEARRLRKLSTAPVSSSPPQEKKP